MYHYKDMADSHIADMLSKTRVVPTASPLRDPTLRTVCVNEDAFFYADVIEGGWKADGRLQAPRPDNCNCCIN
jgi:hypothetical protein